MFFSNNYITRNEVQDMIANLINENTTLKEKIQKLEDNIIQQNNIINEQSTQIKNNTVEINNEIKFNNKLQNMYDPIIQSIRDKQTEFDQKIININCQNNDNINNTCKKVQQQIYDITETLNINNYSQIQSLDEVHKYIQQQIDEIRNKNTDLQEQLYFNKYNQCDLQEKINAIENYNSQFQNIEEFKNKVNNTENLYNEIITQLNTLKDKFDKTNIEHFSVVGMNKLDEPIIKHDSYIDGNHNIIFNQNKGNYTVTKNTDNPYKMYKFSCSILKNLMQFEIKGFSNLQFCNDFSDDGFHIYFHSCYFDYDVNDKIIFKDGHNDEYTLKKSSLKKLLTYLNNECKITFCGDEKYNGKSIRELISLW